MARGEVQRRSFPALAGEAPGRRTRVMPIVATRQGTGRRGRNPRRPVSRGGPVAGRVCRRRRELASSACMRCESDVPGLAQCRSDGESCIERSSRGLAAVRRGSGGGLPRVPLSRQGGDASGSAPARRYRRLSKSVAIGAGGSVVRRAGVRPVSIGRREPVSSSIEQTRRPGSVRSSPSEAGLSSATTGFGTVPNRISSSSRSV